MHRFSQARLPGWSSLALQLNPSPFLFGFLLLLLVSLHIFQEAISSLGVINMLSMSSSSLGKRLALNLFVSHRVTLRAPPVSPWKRLWGLPFEQCPFPCCPQYHLSHRSTCMWPKAQLHVSERPGGRAVVSLPVPSVLVISASCWTMAVPAKGATSLPRRRFFLCPVGRRPP